MMGLSVLLLNLLPSDGKRFWKQRTGQYEAINPCRITYAFTQFIDMKIYSFSVCDILLDCLGWLAAQVGLTEHAAMKFYVPQARPTCSMGHLDASGNLVMFLWTETSDSPGQHPSI